MFGVKNFTAVINPPQSTILAVGAASRALSRGMGGRGRDDHDRDAVLRSSRGRRRARRVLLAAVKRFIEHPAAMLV